MNDVAALAGILIWTGFNFYVWSWKQEQIVLFWQSLGMGGAMFAALFWYVTGAKQR
jgi:hypothetical protein